MKLISLVILTLVTASAALADLTADVRCREIAFSRAAEQRDADSFVSFIDDDARFVGVGVLHGPSAVAEGWQAFFEDDGPAIEWRPQFVEVLDDGQLALSRGPYRVTVKGEDGSESERWGTFNSVWRRQPDGVWKVVFDAGSPAAEPPAEDLRALLDAETDRRCSAPAE